MPEMISVTSRRLGKMGPAYLSNQPKCVTMSVRMCINPLNEWHIVEISLFAKVLRIGVDGVLEIEQQDFNPLPPGGIWLEVLDDSVMLFDDVHICEVRE